MSESMTPEELEKRLWTLCGVVYDRMGFHTRRKAIEFMESVMRSRIDELLNPMTNEQAEKAYDEAIPIPMSRDEIDPIVAYATGRPVSDEQIRQIVGLSIVGDSQSLTGGDE